MHRPVLVTPPAIMPVSLEEAKRHLGVEFADDDNLIQGFIGAATDHLDGWSGILGRCLVEQEWRQEFDRFARELCLPLGSVIGGLSVTWRNATGQVSTVPPASYDLRTDAGGRAVIAFDAGYSFPGDLHESRAVSVTYKAGYPTVPEVPAEGEKPAVPARSTVPPALKTAILLLVAQWYNTRESVITGTITSQMPLAFDALIVPYRRISI